MPEGLESQHKKNQNLPGKKASETWRLALCLKLEGFVPGQFLLGGSLEGLRLKFAESKISSMNFNEYLALDGPGGSRPCLETKKKSKYSPLKFE